MEFIKTDIDGLVLIKPKVHTDHRGFFLETYSAPVFAAAGIDAVFVQDNHSKSVAKGVLRGLHFQTGPFAQSKLVRVISGSIFDVAVDIRPNSPAFGQWRGFELSAANFQMLFIPRGFAHGFCTLEEDTEIVYKVDNPYSRENDAGIIWNDPDIAVAWPDVEPVLSDKDRGLPRLAQINHK
ncbi:MAG: dTDP-4-dehydrorhamnose 3,5-epimerase [Chitinispirillia bacterium]|nr:dTDP-4-dehydrorhamnose 3,5-epimerase [Chitinispirillia bacterium]MCL2241066.1 dTDP-4-dehydrorhamnose 3,5-epimerase [Chitinispirillia bacterium]